MTDITITDNEFRQLIVYAEHYAIGLGRMTYAPSEVNNIILKYLGMTDIDITITGNDFQQLIIYAERYAIGRMTYAPREVNNIILKYLPRISSDTLDVLIQNIELEADRDTLGMDFDKKMWLALLDTLKNERDRRKV